MRRHDQWSADDAIEDIFLDDGAEPQRVGLVREALARHADTDGRDASINGTRRSVSSGAYPWRQTTKMICNALIVRCAVCMIALLVK